MAKEMFISSSPHETKVAVLDDDALVEIYFERDTDVGLVGGIYKGRVSRVLPGMQSAFVDVGLERDAFLYVSDFFEDAEEYDKIVTEAEGRISPYSQAQGSAPVARQEAPSVSAPAAAATEPPPPPEAPPSAETASQAEPVPEKPAPFDHRSRERHGRRRRRRGGKFREQRGSGRQEPRERFEKKAEEPPSENQSFEVLPGESLAKYSHHEEEPAPPSEPVVASFESETVSAEPESAEETTAAPASELPSPEPQTAQSEIPESVSEETQAAHVPETAAPAITAIEPAAATDEGRPKPLWNRIVSSVFGETPTSTETQAPLAEEASTLPSGAEEAPAPESAQPSAESIAQEAEASAPAAEPETNQEVGEPASESSQPQEETGPGQPSEGASTEPAEREYTLREPHQRPRFAPRRGRRGRRGRGRRDFAPRGEAAANRPEGSRSSNHQHAQISELLKEGQEILVQIAKEPLGRKGARITSHIALPGRYLVYMPTVDHTGVSRKIASEEERLRLRNIIQENKGSLTGGFIVRTAAAGQTEEELKSDMNFLFRLWSDIRAKAEATKAPALLHADLDLVQRLLRDTLTPDFKSIWVDNEIEYERAVDFVNRCQPALLGKVKLYTRPTPLFEEFNIQPEIEKALKPKVWLKSGGYIVINQTEALVAIDVNTGKYVGKTNRLEDTIVKTNIDAVNEIVRQIRLRDLGGIIVIDFIDMDERRNRNKVVQALEEALRRDRAPTKILSFNDFGLVAITRKRVKHSLERTLCEPCNYCSGSGWVKSVATVCHEILAEARKMAGQLEGDVATLRVSPEVRRALKSQEGVVLSELEAVLGKNVIVKGDPSVHQERFEIY